METGQARQSRNLDIESATLDAFQLVLLILYSAPVRENDSPAGAGSYQVKPATSNLITLQKMYELAPASAGSYQAKPATSNLITLQKKCTSSHLRAKNDSPRDAGFYQEKPAPSNFITLQKPTSAPPTFTHLF